MIVLMHTWPDLVPKAVDLIADQLGRSVRFVAVSELTSEAAFDPLGFPRPGTRLRDAFAIPT